MGWEVGKVRKKPGESKGTCRFFTEKIEMDERIRVGV